MNLKNLTYLLLSTVILGCSKDVVENTIPTDNCADKQQYSPTIFARSPLFDSDNNINLSTIDSPFAGFQYFWTGPNGFTSNQKNITLPNVPANRGIYSLCLKSNDCATQITTKNVYVPSSCNPPLPLPNIINTPLFVGEEVKLEAELMEGYFYEWTKPDGTIIYGRTIQISNPSSLDFGNYQLKVMNEFCMNQTTVNVGLAPPCGTSVPAPTITTNLPVSFSETITLESPEIPNRKFKWTKPDGSVLFSRILTLPPLYNRAGTYNLDVIQDDCLLTTSSITIPPIFPNLPCTPTNLELRTFSRSEIAFSFATTSPPLSSPEYRPMSFIRFNTPYPPQGIYTVPSDLITVGGFSNPWEYKTYTYSGTIYLSYDSDGKAIVNICNLTIYTSSHLQSPPWTVTTTTSNYSKHFKQL